MAEYILARSHEDGDDDYWAGSDVEWVDDEADALRFDTEEAAEEAAADLPGDEVAVREVADGGLDGAFGFDAADPDEDRDEDR